MMKPSVIIGVSGVLVLFACAFGCDRDTGRPLSLRERENIAYREPDPAGEALRFAVGAMLVPEQGHAHYRLLLEHLERDLGRPIKIVDRHSYAAVNEGLRKGEVDAAFVCSGPYVEGRRQFGLELLVVPQAYGRTSYHAYIIVPAKSDATRFEDLKNRRFAFTDPDSNTGTLVPTHLLAGMGTTPERYFSNLAYTGSHDKSILAVAEGVIDGASVDSLIWDYTAATAPEITSRTRIVWTSPPYGIPPIVVRSGLDPALKERLRELFLGLDSEQEGRDLLAKLMIERFVEGKDSDYDSIRSMKAAVAPSVPTAGAPP